MMAERGLSVDHSTIHRWVLQYGPEMDKRCRPHLRPTNDSWRVDETWLTDKSCPQKAEALSFLGPEHLAKAEWESAF